MAEPRREITIRVFAKTADGRRKLVHSEGPGVADKEGAFWSGQVARTEVKQHLGSELRSRVMDQEGLVDPVQSEEQPRMRSLAEEHPEYFGFDGPFKGK